MTMTSNLPRYEYSPPYIAGARAWREEGKAAVCPHPPQGGTSAKRAAWWNGFYGEKIKPLLEREYEPNR